MGPVRSWYAETIRLSNAISAGSGTMSAAPEHLPSATRRSPIAKVSHGSVLAAAPLSVLLPQR